MTASDRTCLVAPRLPTGMPVGEPAPPLQVGPERAEGSRLVVGAPNAFYSHGKWPPHIAGL